jgi:hypothetical protein
MTLAASIAFFVPWSGWVVHRHSQIVHRRYNLSFNKEASFVLEIFSRQTAYIAI